MSRAQDSVPDLGLVSLNAAVVALADEILRLPASSAADTAAALLWGAAVELPRGFLERVGTGARLPLPALLPAHDPLAVLLPERLRLSAGWRDQELAAKGARAAARVRYRELQAAFVASAREPVGEPASALVRYTYATEGRHWPWADVATRVLDRVVDVNRAALRLLARVARGASPVKVGVPRELLLARHVDLPDAALDAAADALPPVAVPDFVRLARALGASDGHAREDESVARYRSLFAEILGLEARVEIPA
ncbi:MAG: hypothetical protein HY294_09805 [Candidatus Rokubacteria bacterium]|nr:hypothetical protein [Candidatus Rokubacteria bacterium]MBI3826279.1 hypothetical protein [Candidatus Rokubacteria bacterium]